MEVLEPDPREAAEGGPTGLERASLGVDRLESVATASPRGAWSESASVAVFDALTARIADGNQKVAAKALEATALIVRRVEDDAHPALATLIPAGGRRGGARRGRARRSRERAPPTRATRRWSPSPRRGSSRTSRRAARARTSARNRRSCGTCACSPRRRSGRGHGAGVEARARPSRWRRWRRSGAPRPGRPTRNCSSSSRRAWGGGAHEPRGDEERARTRAGWRRRSERGGRRGDGRW